MQDQARDGAVLRAIAAQRAEVAKKQASNVSSLSLSEQKLLSATRKATTARSKTALSSRVRKPSINKALERPTLRQHQQLPSKAESNAVRRAEAAKVLARDRERGSSEGAASKTPAPPSRVATARVPEPFAPSVEESESDSDMEDVDTTALERELDRAMLPSDTSGGSLIPSAPAESMVNEPLYPTSKESHVI